MNNIDKQYTDLLQNIIDNGVSKQDRTGTGTLSVFGKQIRHKMSEGFPLITTKKMHWKSIVTELLWFLRGDTNIKFLLDYDCHIWDGDAYKNYEKNTTDFQLENPIDDFIIKTLRGEMIKIETEDGDDYRILTKEEFIRLIKTDDKFAKKWGELGPIYGKQWRAWGNDEEYYNGSEYVWYGPCDQITNLINDLKTNPDSRRLMVNAWNVGELDQMVLPPCHYGFQVYTRELSFKKRFELWQSTYMPFSQHTKEDIAMFEKHTKEENEKIFIELNIPTRAISLMWNQRSVDTFLGLPFNIASYGLLLEIIAKEVNMVPDELIGNLGDTHLYSNHIEQAKEQIGRTSFDLPTIQITERNWYQHQLVKERLGEKTLDKKLKSYRPDCFELIGYDSHPKIKAPLSN
jgi:thymidylate synthase